VILRVSCQEMKEHRCETTTLVVIGNKQRHFSATSISRVPRIVQHPRKGHRQLRQMPSSVVGRSQQMTGPQSFEMWMCTEKPIVDTQRRKTFIGNSISWLTSPFLIRSNTNYDDHSQVESSASIEPSGCAYCLKPAA